MHPLSTLIEGVSVEDDLKATGWRVRFGGQVMYLREWTWAERRRLVLRATVLGGVDADAFLDGLFRILADHEPDRAWRVPVAVVSLRLLGVPEKGPADSLRRCELDAIRAFGWLPSDLDRQAASSVDALLRELGTNTPSPAATDGPEEGWNRILIAQDRGVSNEGSGQENLTGSEAGIEEALQGLLSAIGCWAGFARSTGTPAAPDERSPHSGGLVMGQTAAAKSDASLSPNPLGAEDGVAASSRSHSRPPILVGSTNEKAPGTARLRRPRDGSSSVSVTTPAWREGAADQTGTDVQCSPKSPGTPLNPTGIRVPGTAESQSGPEVPPKAGPSVPGMLSASRESRAWLAATPNPRASVARLTGSASAASEPQSTRALRPLTREPLSPGPRPGRHLDPSNEFPERPDLAGMVSRQFDANEFPGGIKAAARRWLSDCESLSRAPGKSTGRDEWRTDGGVVEWEGHSATPVSGLEGAFGTSMAEEQLADVLERIAREGGIDLP